MNITLSIDDKLVERARELAQKQGMSLQEMIRGYLENATGASDIDASLQRLRELDDLALRAQRGNSRRFSRFDRDEVYADRLDRYPRKRPAR